MKRPIVGFHLDAAGEWTAQLSCGHPQHVRHDPPLVSRPWVLSVEGRSERLGRWLDCVRCEKMELPNHYVPYRQTRQYTGGSMPPALRAEHAIGAGAWARIVVTEGTVRYQVPKLGIDARLSPGHGGVVVPEVAHSLEPSGAAAFFLIFFRAPDDGNQSAPSGAT